MNYKHIYHAGNFSDVTKHIILISVISELLKKPKSFRILDCFAGSGIYDVRSEESSKTKEFIDEGNELILQLFSSKQKNDILNEYKRIIFDFNNTNNIQLYPGSPFIISAMLRDIDVIVANELNKNEYDNLKNHFRTYKRNFFGKYILKNEDAYNLIKSSVPFPEKRGLIFLDPAFEKKHEFENIIESFKIIQKIFRGAICFIWYPVKELSKVEYFENEIKKHSKSEMIKFSFKISESESKKEKGLKESRIIISNPPDIIDSCSKIFKNISFLDFFIEKFNLLI